MKTFRLPLLAAVAIVASMGAITTGSAGAMPFNSNIGSAVLDDSLVQDIRVVCNSRGQCWNTNRRYRSVRRAYGPRYYRPGYYAEPRYGYGNYYGGPRVGVGVGPFGFGLF